MKLSLVMEMREIDRRAKEEFGVPEILLMENAGKEAAAAFEEFLGGVAGKIIVVLAGSGNNGGDAFAAARHLANHGAIIKTYLVGAPDHLTESTALNRDIVQKMGMKVQVLASEHDWDLLRAALRLADGIIDGMIGTGFSGELRGDMKKIVQTVNASCKPVLAIDIATGIAADTGVVVGEAIRADLTMALGLPKIGQMLAPGVECTGKLIVDDIGIPSALLQDERIKQYLIDAETAAAAILPRPIDAHKGSCGKVLVVAGSRGMTGAAALASQAVLRIGAGMATLAIAEPLHDCMEAKLTEVMTAPLPAITGEGAVGKEAVPKLLKLAESCDAALLGPGLGRIPQTLEMVREFAAEAKIPLILDADAIYAYRNHLDELKNLEEVPVLTPHVGEMAGLLGITVPELRENLLEIVRRAARDYRAIFVVKSECTMAVYPDGQAFITSTGNQGMATAGSGDVLAGAMAGLVKQCEPGLAPLAGVYLHGLAGDLAAKEKGNALIASDILEHLPEARLTLGR